MLVHLRPDLHAISLLFTLPCALARADELQEAVGLFCKYTNVVGGPAHSSRFLQLPKPTDIRGLLGQERSNQETPLNSKHFLPVDPRFLCYVSPVVLPLLCLIAPSYFAYHKSQGKKAKVLSGQAQKIHLALAT